MNDTDQAPAEQQEHSIKGLMLTAVLVLPLAFFLWFYLSGLLVMPVGLALEWVLGIAMPESVHGVSRQAYQLHAELLINPPPSAPAGVGQAIAAVPLNPMIYGYGLALVGGLVFCIPNSGRRRMLQLLVLYLLVVLVQTWGCFWELCKDLLLRQVLGAEGVAMVGNLGLDGNAVGFAYQFGYLVLPSMVPIIAWAILNRRFIEGLVQPGVFSRR